ncbi:unnamed protein product [Bursaphelenchus xylophilus]|uniref:(pine wood nematode) hypothetical protein n=1 Tax=Bursaphelenchus xylophilus TaxID=6326 RepID=A0A1I7S9U4_BURXY|nr:unnamed protein product [Bursaphelenchus xylophilus]CAG9129247.1 unnamed protein product [Bursaphelenchus xylophilus]
MTSVTTTTRKTPASQRPAAGDKRRRIQKEPASKHPPPPPKVEKDEVKEPEQLKDEDPSQQVDEFGVTDWFAENWKPNFRTSFPLANSLDRTRVLNEYIHLIQRYRARVDKVEASPKRVPNPQTQTIQELEKELEKCDAELDSLNKKRENTNETKKELMARYKALYREEDEERKRKEALLTQFDAFSTLFAGNPQALSQAQNLLLSSGLTSGLDSASPGLNTSQKPNGNNSANGLGQNQQNLSTNQQNIGQTLASQMNSSNPSTAATLASLAQSLNTQTTSGLGQNSMADTLLGLNSNSANQNQTLSSGSITQGISNVSDLQNLANQASIAQTLANQASLVQSLANTQKLGQGLSNPSLAQGLGANFALGQSLNPPTNFASPSTPRRNATPSGDNPSASRKSYSPESQRKQKMNLNPNLEKLYNLFGYDNKELSSAESLNANYQNLVQQQQRQQAQQNQRNLASSPYMREFASPIQQQLRQQQLQQKQAQQAQAQAFSAQNQTNPTLQALSQLQNPAALQYSGVRGFNAHALAALSNPLQNLNNSALLQEFANMAQANRFQMAQQQLQGASSAADILNMAKNRNSPLPSQSTQSKPQLQQQAQRKVSTTQFATQNPAANVARLQQLQGMQNSPQQRSSTPQFAVPNLPGQPKMPPRPHSTSRGNGKKRFF